MLAIGILSLFSIGFAGMLGGGSDAEVQPEEEVTLQADDDNTDMLPDLIAPPPADDAPEVPNEDTPDAGSSDVDEETPEDDAPQTDTDDEEVARPPMGEGYNDPLANAIAADAQRVLDEIAAAEARLPINLVTVTGVFDSDVSDDLVLSDAPGTADTTDPEFIVTAPDAPNDIDVGYDAEHTFQIDYNAQTSTINASINSHIQGSDGTQVETITQETDDAGVDFAQTTLTKSYEGSTDITMNIAQAHIGTEIAQIDLSNPADTLHFEFAVDVIGNYHLVYNEVEQDDEGDTNAIRSLYVIETLSTVDVITEEHISTAIAHFAGATGVGIIIAEIFLGEDALDVSGDATTGEDYAMQISNFINQNPQVTANMDWASVSEHQDLVALDSTPSTGGGLGGLGNPFGGLGGFI